MNHTSGVSLHKLKEQSNMVKSNSNTETQASQANEAAVKAAVASVITAVNAVTNVDTAVSGFMAERLPTMISAYSVLGQNIVALQVAMGTEANPASQRAALVAAGEPVSQTKWTIAVRTFNTVGSLSASALAKDIRDYKSYATQTETNPTLLGFLGWSAGDAPVVTIPQLRKAVTEAAEAAGVDFLLFDDAELRALRSAVRAESALRDRLRKQGGKAWTEYQARIVEAKKNVRKPRTAKA